MPDHSPTGAGSVLRDTLARQVELLRLHGAAVADSVDPVAVHQARVATRRLRAALATFRPMLGESASRAERRLRELARSLSALRDLDVAIARLTQWMPDLAPRHHAPMQQVFAALRAYRAELKPAAMRRFSGPAPARAINAVAAIETAKLDAPLEAVALLLSRPAIRKFRKARRRVRRKPGASRIHDLRIRAKKLRYTLEVLGPGLGPRAHGLVTDLRRVQNRLGDFQDAAVITALLERLLLSADPQSALSTAVRRACEAAEKLCSVRAAASAAQVPKLLAGLGKRRFQNLGAAGGAP